MIEFTITFATADMADYHRNLIRGSRWNITTHAVSDTYQPRKICFRLHNPKPSIILAFRAIVLNPNRTFMVQKWEVKLVHRKSRPSKTVSNLSDPRPWRTARRFAHGDGIRHCDDHEPDAMKLRMPFS